MSPQKPPSKIFKLRGISPGNSAKPLLDLWTSTAPQSEAPLWSSPMSLAYRLPSMTKSFKKKTVQPGGLQKRASKNSPPPKKTELPTCWGVGLSGHHESSDSSDASETSKCPLPWKFSTLLLSDSTFSTCFMSILSGGNPLHRNEKTRWGFVFLRLETASSDSSHRPGPSGCAFWRTLSRWPKQPKKKGKIPHTWGRIEDQTWKVKSHFCEK